MSPFPLSFLSEQRYSWQGWWFILLVGTLAVGVMLILWRAIAPGLIWLWTSVRRRAAQHA